MVFEIVFIILQETAGGDCSERRISGCVSTSNEELQMICAFHLKCVRCLHYECVKEKDMDCYLNAEIKNKNK